MRVNLITQSSGEFKSGAQSGFPSGGRTSGRAAAGTIPVSLTIRPACGLPGDYQYPTDSAALLRLLRKQTDLPASVLQRFEASLRGPVGARLLGVELSESVLTDIGYFVD